MARKRKEKDPAPIKLRQPDRSGPDPSQRTLLDIAQERNLFKAADECERVLRKSNASTTPQRPGQSGSTRGEKDDEELLPPYMDRIMDTLLWTISLSMLHFTLDVLVQHQYAVEIEWPKIVVRSGQAFLVFVLLFYTLHPWESSPSFIPGIPLRYQAGIRQAIFLVMSVVAGCYLIHVTNMHGYLAVMKTAPTMGCLWVWAVIELDLGLSVVSLAVAGAFIWWGGYKIK